jgi:hypothetical protein
LLDLFDQSREPCGGVISGAGGAFDQRGAGTTIFTHDHLYERLSLRTTIFTTHTAPASSSWPARATRQRRHHRLDQRQGPRQRRLRRRSIGCLRVRGQYFGDRSEDPRAARDAVRIDSGAALAITRKAFLFGSFLGEFSRISPMYAGKGGARLPW